MYKVAADQGAAAATRHAGAASNLMTITQGIGKIGGSASLIENFSTSIGGVLNNCIGYLGDWNTALEPMISAFGSFEQAGLNGTITSLNNSVQQDLQSVGNSTQNGKPSDEDRANALNLLQSNKSLDYNQRKYLNNLSTPHVQIEFGL